MRILFLSTWYPFPPDNGSKIRAYYLLKALAHAHEVTLVSFARAARDGGEAHGLPENLVHHVVAGSPFRYVGLPSLVKYASPIPVAFWPQPAMLQTVTQLAKDAPWDAVVAIQVPVGRYALKLTNVPRVLDLDTSLSYQLYERAFKQVGWFPRLRSRLSLWKAIFYESQLVRRFQIGVLASPLERGFVSSLAEDTQIEVLPNGVDCDRHRLGIVQTRDNSLVYNGALTYSANYDAIQFFLTAIMPLIKCKVADVNLTITGSTVGVNLAALPLDENVHFSGYVEDIRPLIADCRVCIVPLREGGGTRLKILEAMALGTPVISTTKGAEGLDVVDGEHLLISDEPESFAAQTVELMSNEDLRRYLTYNARKLVEQKYDWVEIGRRFVALVESVVQARLD